MVVSLIHRVQELAGDRQREAGRIPRTIEIELTSDLVDSCVAGDMVTVTAVVKATGTNEGGVDSIFRSFSKQVGSRKCQLTILNTFNIAGECSAIHPRKLLSIMEWPRNQTYRDVATILP